MARKTRKSPKTRMKKFIALSALVLAGILYFGYPYLEFARLWFSVIGVDVSHHQNEIDWKTLTKTDVRFAYVKATEGGDYVDPLFQQNWKDARAAGLAVGAYHFFTRCKTGADQAKNFLAVLPSDIDALPPVLDAEKMEPCGGSAPELDPLKEIHAFIDAVNAKAGCKPILYVSQEFELRYFDQSLDGELFWVRGIFDLPGQRHRNWVLWQYHDAGSREGVTGPLDLDVFRGTANDFETFRKTSTCFKKVPA
jgi:lysozyme